jgi:peptidoglycan/LPS O-acetylase OafA/YrhL
MIRLRETLERACRHRWLGPLVIVLLVVLIAFVAIHEGGEKVFESAGELCVALAALVLTILVQLLPPGLVRPPQAPRRRGPLHGPTALPAGDLKFSITLAPLRL